MNLIEMSVLGILVFFAIWVLFLIVVIIILEEK